MLEAVKILAVDLEVGMYVTRLDRPWLETPFTLQGFRLDSRQEIERLQTYCQYVYIDTAQSSQASTTIQRKVRTQPRRPVQEFFPKRTLKNYQDGSDWGGEYSKAIQAIEILSKGIDEIFDGAASGGVIDVVKAKRSVDPMIDSIIRNPDACVWLARSKQEDKYTYQHALGASIWAVALGRKLGLPKADLRSLAIGGLLFDVGKLRVAGGLVETDRPLSDEEFQQVRDHVLLGADMIEGSGLMNQDVIDMITYHHERHDGSGYPKGLRGDDIPVFARIAAIVDCYDAITSHRSYARAMAPSQAVKMLYEWKDVEFQPELVEQFIQAVGVYPAGSLVELSTGEIAVVVAGYRTRRLRPRVMVVLNADKSPLEAARSVDLMAQTHTDDGQALDIVNSLEPDAYGLNMSAILL
jgi:putative nucleotidyltransferase with HDIG domain